MTADTDRLPLTRDRVLRAAVALADEHGLAKLSMRRLGSALGVEAMSLYNHVRNKDELLDGIVDHIIGEIEVPDKDDPWRPAMHSRALSARAAFKRHPWAAGLMDARTNPGPIALHYYDAVIGCLRHSGFSIQLAAHAFSVLDSYVYGFALHEAGMPFASSEELHEVSSGILEAMPAEAFPHLTEMIVEHALKPGYDYGHGFDFGLDLILDGLQRALP